MNDLFYIDRDTHQQEKEKVYGGVYLKILYGDGFFSKCLAFFFLPLICKISFLSNFFGFLQKTRRSKRKVKPFIKKFSIDSSEFEKDSFSSFNDFFIRKLHSSKRPIHPDSNVAILPADGRYRIFPKIQDVDRIAIKGKSFSLEELLGDETLAKRYQKGSMVMVRLCPVDYHRFHFPCGGIPSKPHLINGPLYSVNPIALRKNISILCENKRMITSIETKKFKTLQFIEIGATYVGSIKQTYTPGKPSQKGEEKGYFEFGGSCILLLFEDGVIKYDADLMSDEFEIRAKYGQSMGRSIIA